MGTAALPRKLCAILYADVAGYSRLMGADEDGTHRTLKTHLGIASTSIREHHGHIVHFAGDAVLADFATVSDALRCAVAMQNTLKLRNRALPDSRKLQFRVGVNLGEVIVDNNEIFGDGVNVAARLESLAEPGGICISGTVYDAVGSKLRLAYQFIGEQKVKNIAQPVRLYRVALNGDGEAVQGLESGFVSDAGTPDHATEGATVAVLPFQNLSGMPEQEYFCDGITNDITTDLSKFRNLFVIAAHSAFVYKNKPTKVQEIGRELSVNYLLEGSVQRIKERVRINTQLIDTHTGHHIWADRFDREFAEIFALQDTIIRKIVVALALKVDAVERERAHRKPLNNINAYEAYLKGVHLFSLETSDALDQSIAMFRHAVRLDPRYARAWGYLAYSYARGVIAGWKNENALHDAETYAKKAVRLDADDYNNHWDLGFVYLRLGQFERALGAYQTALRLNCNDPDLLVEIAEMLIYAGDTVTAMQHIEQALLLNPHSPDWYYWVLAWGYYNRRQYENALAALDRMLDPPADARLLFAAVHAQVGNAESAKSALDQFLTRIGTPYTIDDLRKRGVFKDANDEKHWFDGLRKAGLQV